VTPALVVDAIEQIYLPVSSKERIVFFEQKRGIA